MIKRTLFLFLLLLGHTCSRAMDISTPTESNSHTDHAEWYYSCGILNLDDSTQLPSPTNPQEFLIRRGNTHVAHIWKAENQKVTTHPKGFVTEIIHPFVPLHSKTKITAHEYIKHEHTAPITTMTWSPDGTMVATGSRDHTVRIWNAADGKHLKELQLTDDWATAVAWSPDGNEIAMGSAKGLVYFYDVTLEEMTSHRYHAHQVTALAYRPNGTTLATGSIDGTVHLYKRLDGQLLRSYEFNPPVTCLAWSSNSHSLKAHCTHKLQAVLFARRASVMVQPIPASEG